VITRWGTASRRAMPASRRAGPATRAGDRRVREPDDFAERRAERAGDDAAPWLAPYLHELAVFPNGKHDDQVDSTAQMLDWFKRGSGPSSNAGIFELYRQRAEELRRGQAPGPPVRLRAPRGVGAVQLLSGLRRNVAADGTVEMSGSDAEPLLRAGWVRVDVGDAAAT
jgi:hypothetical protein